MVHQLPQCTGKLSLPRSLPLFHSLSSSLCPSLSFSISLSVPIEPHLLLSSPHHVHSHDLADSLFLFLIWGLHFFKSCLSDVVRVSSSPLSLLALFTQMQIRQPYCTCPHWCRKVSFCHSFAGVFLKTELCGHAGVWFTTFHNRGQCPVYLLYSDLNYSVSAEMTPMYERKSNYYSILVESPGNRKRQTTTTTVWSDILKDKANDHRRKNQAVTGHVCQNVPSVQPLMAAVIMWVPLCCFQPLKGEDDEEKIHTKKWVDLFWKIRLPGKQCNFSSDLIVA